MIEKPAPKAPGIVFASFAFLFQLGYFPMILLMFDNLAKQYPEGGLYSNVGLLCMAEVTCAVVFMTLQGVMVSLFGKPAMAEYLKGVWAVAISFWFCVEVIFGYWFTFEMGVDPVTGHTPFVLVFSCFHAAQIWALKSKGVLQVWNVDVLVRCGLIARSLNAHVVNGPQCGRDSA